MRSRLPALLCAALLAAPAAADPADDAVDGIAVPIVGGVVKLDARARYEYADAAGTAESNAATVRTRLGYATAAWHGLSGFVEMENVAAADRGAYFDGVPPGNGRTVVADPTGTELNQAFAQLERPELGGSLVRAGRQRLTLDDHRFVGNVGWRQNEQTYDAVWAQSALGVDGLSVGYGWVAEVHRIFGDRGATAATQDWESSSHLVRVGYEAAPWLQAAAFAYLLDLRTAPANSSNTYGLRLTGRAPLAEEWSAAYQASWAWQTDGGTSGGDNPADYEAHYAALDLSLAFAPLGAVGGGYELLGSDRGHSVFVTPLATAHKFNGWADAFLNNGGPPGLQDLYAYVRPALPWKLDGEVAFHEFWSHDRGRHLGWELDAVLSRKLGKYVTVLTKVAWYEQGSSLAPSDRTRFWIEATLAF